MAALVDHYSDILNLPSYSFYAKIAATDPLEPLSGRTVVLPKDEASADVASDVISSSRELYASEYAENGKSASVGSSADGNQAKGTADDSGQNPGDGALPGGVK